jgi:hypothetical protein
MKFINKTLFGLAIISLFCSAPTLASTISMETASDQVAVGSTFRLEIRIDESTDLYSMLFDLVYDNNLLEVVDVNTQLSGVQPQVTLGSALNPDGSAPTPIYAAGVDDQDAGRALVALSRHTVGEGADITGGSSNVLVVDLLMRAVAQGTANIAFAEENLRNSSNDNIPGNTWEGITLEIIESTNQPPTQPQIAISPELPMTIQDLVCNIIVASTDPNGDTVTYLFEWQKNGEGFFSGTATLTSDQTLAGETWTCRVTPTDGTADGPPSIDQVTVGYVGDLNRDFLVDLNDLFSFSISWNSSTGDPEFYSLADMNLDGDVTVEDLLILHESIIRGPTP